jgi:serine/threonine protein kinase
MEYGQASDMWAVGVFAYFLTTGVMPFEHTVSGLYKALRGEYEPMDESMDKNARDLVSKLLVLNPSKRINAAQAATHRYLRKGYEAHRHVAQGDSLQVPSSMVSSAKKQLRALVMQESLERHTVSLLADKLNPEDVTTLRRWLGMKAEKSVHRGTANIRMKHQIIRSASQSPSAATPDDTVSGGHAYIDDVQAQRALDLMYKDYADRDSGSKDTSFHGRGMSQSASFAALSDALNKLAQEEDKEEHSPPSKSSPPAKPPRPTLSEKLSRSSPGSSGRLSRTGSSNNLVGRSFVGIAHASGFCTIDELITACLSARLTIVADELDKVRSSLKMERMEKLKSMGIDSQDESVLLDIILFRHDDLLSRVEAIHMRQLKDWSVRGGTRSIVFDGSAQYVKPDEGVENA